MKSITQTILLAEIISMNQFNKEGGREGSDDSPIKYRDIITLTVSTAVDNPWNLII